MRPSAKTRGSKKVFKMRLKLVTENREGQRLIRVRLLEDRATSWPGPLRQNGPSKRR